MHASCIRPAIQTGVDEVGAASPCSINSKGDKVLGPEP